MALTEQVVQVNVLAESPEPRVYMVQYDTGRTVRCIIQDWDIPSGATARVFVKKVSGKVVYTDCTVDRTTNSVLITVTNQMIAEAGADNLAMVEITSGGECVTTFAFFLVVKYKFGEGEESKNEVTWVDELMQEYIDKAAALADSAGTAATSAEQSAKTAQDAAENTEKWAQQAENTIETIKDAADRAEKAAESAAESESNAVASAESVVKAADEVLAESEKIDERLERAEGLIDSTIDAAESAAESASAANTSAESAEDAAARAAASAEDASQHSLVEISDKEVVFTEATEREDIQSGETLSTLFGKVKKWFSSLAQVAFSGDYADLSGTENVQIKTGDSAENTVTFVSADADDADAWMDVELLSSGEKHASMFEKISAMFCNIRLLHRMLGDGSFATGLEGDINYIERWITEVEERVEILESLHDIVNTRIPFAVYCADDSSLTFYSAIAVPEVDSVYNGKAVTKVYTDFTDFVATGTSQIPWYSDRTKFTTIVFDKSFSRVRPISMAFWFDSCNATTNFDLSGINTSEVTNMQYTFRGCNKMTTFDLTPLDTSKVTTMYYMFGSCTAMTELDLSPLNTANVEDFRYMFYNDYKLTKLDLSPLNTSKATTIQRMFYSCSGLIELDLTPFDTANVTDMQYLFSSCSGLTKVDISSLETSNVTNMNSMFGTCSSLTELDISTLDTANVTNMTSMFQNCSNLVTIYSDDDVFVTTKVTSGSGMFTGCSNLVGGNGTTYSSSQATYAMAHIDTADNPGYFTAK